MRPTSPSSRPTPWPRLAPLAALLLACSLPALGQTGSGGRGGDGAGPASAAQGPGGTAATASGSLARADRSFIEKAALGGLAEVQLGDMAQQRAADAQVKAFAARMVQDHGKANEELKSLAQAKGVQLPAALDDTHRRDAEKLGQLSGAEFDRAYMKHMVDDHRQDVADFRRAARGAGDSQVKDFAARTLPTLESHLQLARTTYEAVSAKKTP